MAHFLVKTEPSSYSFADLLGDGKTVWDGISNPVALRNLATVRAGDTIVVYHTGDEKQAVGLAAARSAAYPDPKLDDPKRVVIEIEPKRAFAKPVTLAQVKADPVLQQTALARQPRLSVVPLDDAQFARLLELAGEKRR